MKVLYEALNFLNEVFEKLIMNIEVEMTTVIHLT